MSTYVVSDPSRLIWWAMCDRCPLWEQCCDTPDAADQAAMAHDDQHHATHSPTDRRQP